MLPLFSIMTLWLYLTSSAKRKKRKPRRSATDGALGRLQSNSTSMVFKSQIHSLKLLPEENFVNWIQSIFFCNKY